MTAFVAIEAAASASRIEQEIYETLEAKFEGWAPAEGNLEVWLIKAFSRVAASVFDMASLMSKEAFKKFGEAIVNVPPVLAAPAFVESTWTMIDAAGYTIPAGTQVEIEASGDRHVGFATTEEIVVAPEAMAATVPLRAIESGEEGNELTADPTLVDALAFVDSITLDGTTANGVDAEEEDAYLDRLVETLQLLSLALILPRDFEIDARAVGWVFRAICIRNYNPVDKTTGNVLMQCIVPVDVSGQPGSSPGKAELLERQEAKLLTDVIHHVADPDYTPVDVWATFAVRAGFDPVAVTAAVADRLASYLSPANWGIPSSGDASSIGGWENQPKVYRFELISEVDRVGGVDRGVTVLLGGGAGKAFTVAASTDIFSSTAHGFSSGDAVVLRTGLTPGAPLAAGTVYFVRDVATNTFKVAATVGGAAINITSDGSGVVSKLSTAESLTLTGVAPLTKPGEIIVAAV
jgi:hypothetical protein